MIIMEYCWNGIDGKAELLGGGLPVLCHFVNHKCQRSSHESNPGLHGKRPVIVVLMYEMYRSYNLVFP